MKLLGSLLQFYEQVSAREKDWRNRSELDGIRALWLSIPVPISAAVLVTLSHLGYGLTLCTTIAITVHSILLPVAFLAFSRYADWRARRLAATDDLRNRERLVKEELESEIQYVSRLSITPAERDRLVQRAIQRYENQMGAIEVHRSLGYRVLTVEQITELAKNPPVNAPRP